MPEPKWKLIVDVGDEADNLINAAAQQQAAVGVTDGSANDGEDARIAEVVSLLGEHMPSDPSSPMSQYLPGFMSLRLLLLQSGKNVANIDIIQDTSQLLFVIRGLWACEGGYRLDACA